MTKQEIIEHTDEEVQDAIRNMLAKGSPLGDLDMVIMFCEECKEEIIQPTKN